jgi:hypothetical protein
MVAGVDTSTTYQRVTGRTIEAPSTTSKLVKGGFNARVLVVHPSLGITYKDDLH